MVRKRAQTSYAGGYWSTNPDIRQTCAAILYEWRHVEPSCPSSANSKVSAVPGLPDDRHTASLVGLRGGWRHARMKFFTRTYGSNAAVPGNEMSSKSPFSIQRALIGIGGEPKSVKRLRSATRGLLATDHVILNHGQVTWTTPELAPPSPNYHTNGRTFQLSTDLTCIAALHGNWARSCDKASHSPIPIPLGYRGRCYSEARKLIVPQLSQTYAQAAKSSTSNNSTQTDENVSKIKCPPLKLFEPLHPNQDQMYLYPLLMFPDHLLPKPNSCHPPLQ
ncbi:hypothetical protein TNCV_697491 [Trichonephila clavipes]|nr:hypothetical protein TNCV_697491 [Trichonephila clavipes]